MLILKLFMTIVVLAVMAFLLSEIFEDYITEDLHDMIKEFVVNVMVLFMIGSITLMGCFVLWVLWRRL